jgi:hypothetical protein
MQSISLNCETQSGLVLPKPLTSLSYVLHVEVHTCYLLVQQTCCLAQLLYLVLKTSGAALVIMLLLLSLALNSMQFITSLSQPVMPTTLHRVPLGHVKHRELFPLELRVLISWILD